MSGRPAPNRGKRSHRKGFDSADGHYQPGSSSNHSGGKYGGREPPPRFLSRQRNGNGRSNSGGDSRDGYDDYSSRKEGGGHKGGGRSTGSPSAGGGRSSNLGESTIYDKCCLHVCSSGKYSFLQTGL